MKHIETLKLALEALDELFNTKSYWWQEVDDGTHLKLDAAKKDLRQAIKQAEQAKPVAEPYGQVTVVRRPGCVDQHWFYRWPEPPYLDNAAECHTVYTQAPPPRKPEPLTPEEILAIRDAHTPHLSWGIKDFARAVIAAYEAKNGITKGEA